MEEIDYYSVFKELGIEIEPLPANYDPDEYGKHLASTIHTSESVQYSAYTNTNDQIETNNSE